MNRSSNSSSEVRTSKEFENGVFYKMRLMFNNHAHYGMDNFVH